MQCSGFLVTPVAVKAATTIQSLWRRYKAVSEFETRSIIHLLITSSLTHAERLHTQRTNVAKEILSTEETYVNDLRKIVTVYIHSALFIFSLLTLAEVILIPLRENGILDESDIKLIFSNIEIILGMPVTDAV